jgi:DNA-binding FadR family transcriptional regulator
MALEGEVRRVADVILERIVAGTYPSGLRLPSEAELAAELGCGRSTVREALRHLAGLGVVASRRGSGALVLDFRREGTLSLLPPYLAAGRFDLPPAVLARELLHLRAMLATEAVRLAARYARPGALARARAVLDEATPADAVAQAMRELELFREIVCASGVWPAVWLANAYWAPLRELHRSLAPVVGGPPADFVPAMRALLDRVERRDEQGAVDHVRRWLDGVDGALLAALEPALARDPVALPGGPRP